MGCRSWFEKYMFAQLDWVPSVFDYFFYSGPKMAPASLKFPQWGQESTWIYSVAKSKATESEGGK
jgi:hypothetical protein